MCPGVNGLRLSWSMACTRIFSQSSQKVGVKEQALGIAGVTRQVVVVVDVPLPALGDCDIVLC